MQIFFWLVIHSIRVDKGMWNRGVTLNEAATAAVAEWRFNRLRAYYANAQLRDHRVASGVN